MTYYEGITRTDTLMMALLYLWKVQARPNLKLNLIYNER